MPRRTITDRSSEIANQWFKNLASDDTEPIDAKAATAELVKATSGNGSGDAEAGYRELAELAELRHTQTYEARTIIELRSLLDQAFRQAKDGLADPDVVRKLSTHSQAWALQRGLNGDDEP
jgi:hypothetical protein